MRAKLSENGRWVCGDAATQVFSSTVGCLEEGMTSPAANRILAGARQVDARSVMEHVSQRQAIKDQNPTKRQARHSHKLLALALGGLSDLTVQTALKNDATCRPCKEALSWSQDGLRFQCHRHSHLCMYGNLRCPPESPVVYNTEGLGLLVYTFFFLKYIFHFKCYYS